MRQKLVSRIELIVKHAKQVAMPWRWLVNAVSSECLEHDKTEGKRVHFKRQVSIFILGAHIEKSTYHILGLQMRGSYTTLVRGCFANAKIADASHTVSIEQNIRRFDVSMNDLDL